MSPISGTVLLRNRGGTLPLSATGGGTIAVIGPSASASPTYGGGGSAYVLPSSASSTVTPLQGLQSAAGAGTSVNYTQGLPTDSQLTAIPSSDLSTPFPTGGVGFRRQLLGDPDRAGDRHLRAGDHQPVRLLLQ